MATALVTGVTGQDGGYLVEALQARGDEVHALVRRGEQTDALLARSPGLRLHLGELSEEGSLRAALVAADPDEVYHLAGISSVAYSWEHPVHTAEVTALGAARLLELTWQAQQARGRPIRFLQAASAEMFGIADVSPQDEDTPVRPTSPYGAAKAFAHHLVGVYRARGMFAVSLLLYNHESPRRPPTFVTRKITQAAARISRGLQDELVLGNLDVRRDWGWAPDYVRAMMLALGYDRAEDFIIATGEAHSVRDFVAAAFARAGVADWEQRVRVDPAFVRPTDAGLQAGNAAKAGRLLGWAPSVGFTELVGRMVDADLDPLG